MAYVPDPTDVTNPTDAIQAETAQAEFRALKAYIQTLAFSAGNRLPVRECVLDGLQDANGFAAFLSSSGAFNLSILGTTTPLAVTWANGFTATGAVDNVQLISADMVNCLTVSASNTSYVSLDYVNTTVLSTVNGGVAAGAATLIAASVANFAVGMAVSIPLMSGNTFSPVITAISIVLSQLTFASTVPLGDSIGTGVNITGFTPFPQITLAPPQYGRVYDTTKQAVLQFAGVVGTTVFLDDFGNTWTVHGGSKIQTNQFKFGTGALGGGGASNALSGTDYINNTSITSYGSSSWAVRAWVYMTALPANNTDIDIFGLFSASGLGGFVGVDNNAGTIRWRITLSSNGTSIDIGAPVGTTLPAINTWYFVELTFDVLSGNYRLYINGTQEIVQASAAKIANCLELSVGSATNHQAAHTGLQGYIDKFEFLPYCQHPAGTAYVSPTAAPSVSAVGYASDWFDTVNYKMKTVSAASVVAGTPPTFTQKNRLYIGEVDSSAGTVTTFRAYNFQGSYTSAWVNTLAGLGTQVSKADNLGTFEKSVKLELMNLTTEGAFTPGQIVTEHFGTNGSNFYPITVGRGKNTSQFTAPSSAYDVANAGSGAITALTLANWAYRLVTRRNF